VVAVEQWAEVRRLHFVRGLSIHEIHRRTGLHRDTIRRALRSERPPRYERAPRGSKLDPFKDEIHRLLAADPTLSGVRIRELLAPLGSEGQKTIVDDYLREIRPVVNPPRIFQRTIYRPGEYLQFDLWEPRAEIPVGHGQLRRGYVVVACLGYSRAGAGTLIFSKQTEDLLFGIRRCLWSLGALPETLVWDRQAGLHAGGGRPTREFAGFCGPSSPTGTSARRATRRPRASSSASRTTSSASSSPAGASPTSSTTSSSSTSGSRRRTGASTARCAVGPKTACAKSGR
jgi:transposase